jgi:hypothetical protein
MVQALKFKNDKKSRFTIAQIYTDHTLLGFGDLASTYHGLAIHTYLYYIYIKELECEVQNLLEHITYMTLVLHNKAKLVILQNTNTSNNIFQPPLKKQIISEHHLSQLLAQSIHLPYNTHYNNGGINCSQENGNYCDHKSIYVQFTA